MDIPTSAQEESPEELPMPLWKIRVVLSDDPASQNALTKAVSAYPPGRVRVLPLDPDSTTLTGDVVVELRDDGPLGDLLHSLHQISPHVFVSRANPPTGLTPRPMSRVLEFKHRLGAY